MLLPPAWQAVLRSPSSSAEAHRTSTDSPGKELTGPHGFGAFIAYCTGDSMTSFALAPFAPASPRGGEEAGPGRYCADRETEKRLSNSELRKLSIGLRGSTELWGHKAPNL